MNGIYHISFEVRDILHVLLADKCEALGISQILPEHVVAGAVRLVLHIAEYLIQNRKLVVLID